MVLFGSKVVIQIVTELLSLFMMMMTGKLLKVVRWIVKTSNAIKSTMQSSIEMTLKKGNSS